VGRPSPSENIQKVHSTVNNGPRLRPLVNDNHDMTSQVHVLGEVRPIGRGPEVTNGRNIRKRLL
jgi:hypothetical protein